MTACKDNALCLRLRAYSETSQIVTLFGREYGKIRAIAKGSKRAKSKFSGGIDLLSNGHVIFHPPRNESTLATLAEFELDQSFSVPATDVAALYIAQLTAELLCEFTEDLDPHETLFDAASDTWRQLQQAGPTEALLVNFELALLQEVGLMPVWDVCCACRQPLPQGPRLYFTSGGGGMLCPDCEPAVYEKRFVDPPALELLRHPNTPTETNRTADRPAHELLAYHIRELLGKETTTMVFVNRLLAQRKVR